MSTEIQEPFQGPIKECVKQQEDLVYFEKFPYSAKVSIQRGNFRKKLTPKIEDLSLTDSDLGKENKTLEGKVNLREEDLMDETEGKHQHNSINPFVTHNKRLVYLKLSEYLERA